MTSPRIGRSMLLAMTAAIAAMALSAPVASAEIEDAKWQQSTSTMRWQGALTVDSELGAPKSCSSLTATGTAKPGSSEWAISNALYYWSGINVPVLKASCAGGTQLMIKLDPQYVGVSPFASYESEAESYSLVGVFESGVTLPSPYGNYYQAPFEVPFTNAGEGGASKSTVDFAETVIGMNGSSGNITLTGTITVDDGKGNPRTLSN